MRPAPIRQTLDKPLMAKAFGDAVGATKRQVQFWTAHGVLQFLPGSGGGTGNQRLYPQTEVPFAALARHLAAAGIQVGTIEFAVFMVRTEITNSTLHGANPQKFRRYLRGEEDSYILVRTHPKAGGRNKRSVTWIGAEDLAEYLGFDHATTVINVRKVMGPHTS